MISQAETIRKNILTAFAVGDAAGMPTEFMRPEEIRRVTGGSLPDGLIDAPLSQNHSDLPRGSVTDDTEQVLYLMAQARRDGALTAQGTVKALRAWIRETDAVAKHYIGPSSVRALEAIKAGADINTAGMGGTTCGGIMRTPAAVLWNLEQNEDELKESIYQALLPTHHTSEALEAAGAYGFALAAAMKGADLDEIFAEAERGGKKLMARAPYAACAPSSVARIRVARQLASRGQEEMLDTLFSLWGTGLPSADVCGAVFAIFAFAGADAWLAIRLGAAVGGDTDTIAALSGALSAAYAGRHNIPDAVADEILTVNRPLFEGKYPEVYL